MKKTGGRKSRDTLPLNCVIEAVDFQQSEKKLFYSAVAFGYSEP